MGKRGGCIDQRIIDRRKAARKYAEVYMDGRGKGFRAEGVTGEGVEF